MSTVLQVITDSMRELGLLAASETPRADEVQDCLRKLNDMLDSWSNESLFVYGTLFESFMLQANKSSYTMGSGGDFDTEVPIRTNAIRLKDSNNLELPVSIIDANKYGRFTVKENLSTYPRYAYIDDGHPLKTVYFYETPSQAIEVIFHNQRQLTTFTDVSTNINFPKGYRKAIVNSLAIEIAPQFGATPSPITIQNAGKAIANIKRANKRPLEMRVDNALTFNNRVYDIEVNQ